MELPQVVIRPAGETADRLRITVDGEEPTKSIRRSDLGRTLARLAEDAGTPVRVEVHEPDGSVYADIINPQQPTDAAPSSRTEPGEKDTSTVSGFHPGETVLIAVVTHREVADASGEFTMPTPPEGSLGTICHGADSGSTITVQ